MGLLDFVPELAIIVGTGGRCEEALMMREEWPELSLYGYEPSPNAAAAVRNTFPGNLREVGIWSERCKKPLHVKGSWLDGSTFYAGGNGAKPHLIQCHRLDEFADDFGLDHLRNTVLWIDAEGAELEVLKGAEKVLARTDVLNVELTSYGRQAGWVPPIDVHTFLVARGFRQFAIHSIRSVIGQRDAIYIRNELYDPDLTQVF